MAILADELGWAELTSRQVKFGLIFRAKNIVARSSPKFGQGGSNCLIKPKSWRAGGSGLNRAKTNLALCFWAYKFLAQPDPNFGWIWLSQRVGLKLPPLTSTFQNLKELMSDAYYNNEGCNLSHKDKKWVRWIHLINGIFKLNFDDSRINHISASRWVIRDSNGIIKVVGSRHLSSASIITT